jgi:fatty-acyl-CoA synthase
VSPKEIEDVLGERSDVSQVHVVGLPDERMGEVGCAIIVPAPGAELTVAEIDAYCRARLARFKVPRHVVFVSSDQLPTTATGKVQKFRLCELASVLAKTTGDEPASASAG